MPLLARWLLIGLLAAGCASTGKHPAQPAGQPSVLDESALMAGMRAEVKTEPASALSVSEDAERRFGDSAFAEERRALAIQALINLGRIGSARSRAYGFLERYPDGPYSANVAAMTGVHVTPKGPWQGK